MSEKQQKVTIDVQGRVYDFPQAPYTFRESKLVKSITGYSIAGIDPRTAMGDTDLLLAFAVLAKRRAGETFDEDALLDLEISAVRYIVEEDDPGPPAGAPTSGASETADDGAEKPQTPTETPEPSGNPDSPVSSD